MKRIVFVCDAEGWAYERVSLNLQAELKAHYRVDIIYQTDPEFEAQLNEPADLWIYHHVSMAERYGRTPAIIKLAGYRCLDPYAEESGGYSQRLADILTGQSIVALNEGLAEIGRQFTARVAYITNGLDLDRFHPDTPERPWPTPDHTVVGFVANISQKRKVWYKGYSFAEVACDELGVEFRPLGYSSRTATPTTRYSKMPGYYNSVHVLLHPSLQEGSCSAIMEALACGTPVITTRTGYHGEMLTHRENVLFVERNVADIRNAIRWLWDHPASYQRLSTASRDFAVKHHDIHAVAEQWRQAIEEAMA